MRSASLLMIALWGKLCFHVAVPDSEPPDFGPSSYCWLKIAPPQRADALEAHQPLHPRAPQVHAEASKPANKIKQMYIFCGVITYECVASVASLMPAKVAVSCETRYLKHACIFRRFSVQD